ncbi:MAG TPA: sugar transferase [Acidimicrobiales bacterium]|nr:sugar transferase [Acidimicrobiales bacterium]
MTQAAIGTVACPTWFGKRAFDLATATLLQLVFLPLMALLALAVKLTSPGPVLFRHERIGRGGQPFAMLKFRSMEAAAEQRLAATPALFEAYVGNDHKLATAVDPRVTGLGRFLRLSSLDELPQLFNVLAGHMSLVGPRPVTSHEFPMYGHHDRAYLELRPGLTGLWQVSGRNAIRFPQRAEIDADYWRRCGPFLDLRILATTPVAVLTRRGVK